MPRFAGYRRAEWYLKFRRFMMRNGIQLPRNQDAPGSRHEDKVLRIAVRDLACVIEFFRPDIGDYQALA